MSNDDFTDLMDRLANEDRPDPDDLEDVVGFASWCVASGCGDWDPRIETEEAAVRTDPGRRAYWREKLIEYTAASDTGCGIFEFGFDLE